MTLFTLALVLFLIMDPVGRINAFVNCLEGIDHKRQKTIVARELVIALGVMLFFNFVGERIFAILEISNITVFLSSGIILFLASIKILFPTQEDQENQRPTSEPFLVPLAIPMIAGPGLLATIMLYASSEESVFTMVTAITLAWAAAAVVLFNAKALLRVLTPSGLIACEKLMGMVLVLLSVQRFLEGIILLCQSYSNV